MGKQKFFLALAVSGHNAKRRVINCPNSLISCYLGVDNNVKSCQMFGLGTYNKIEGDPSQPKSFTRSDNDIIYNDNEDKNLIAYSQCCILNQNITHYRDNNLISVSKLIDFEYIPNIKRTSKTRGYANFPKFNNTLCVGDYESVHKYDTLDNGNIRYINSYIFSNGHTSSATYINNKS